MQVQTTDRNLWFKTVFFPALRQGADGLTQVTINTERTNATKEDIVKSVKAIFNTIRTLSTTYTLDDQFKTLAEGIAWKDSEGRDNIGSPEFIASLVANFCKEKEIYFDDEGNTNVNIQAFKNGIFGKALTEYKCFTSQQQKIAPNKPTSTRTSAPSAGKPKVANCNGIVSGKIALSGDIYWIGGTFINIGKTIPRIHIKPTRSLNSKGELEVFTNGSGQGFEDCVLFWTDKNATINIANQIDSNKHGSKVKDYQVKRQTAKGEYYIVKTEFGDAYIKADNLVEALKPTRIFNEEANEFFRSL